VGPQAERKVFTLQTLPVCDDADEPFADTVGEVANLSLHAGAASKADERKYLERLCRYIARPAVSEKRLSLTAQSNVRYQLKTRNRDGTTHVGLGSISIRSLSSLIITRTRWRRYWRNSFFRP